MAIDLFMYLGVHSPHPPFSVHGFVQYTIYIRKTNCLHFFSLVIVGTFVPWLPLTRPVKAAYVKCRIKGYPDLHTNQLRGDLSAAHPKGVQPNRESSWWWIIYSSFAFVTFSCASYHQKVFALRISEELLFW